MIRFNVYHSGECVGQLEVKSSKLQDILMYQGRPIQLPAVDMRKTNIPDPNIDPKSTGPMYTIIFHPLKFVRKGRIDHRLTVEDMDHIENVEGFSIDTAYQERRELIEKYRIPEIGE